MAKKKNKSDLAKGQTSTRTITRGPNKGDVVVFKGSPSGHPFPVRVLKDVGNDSTLKGDVPFGKKKKKKK